jgi:hypothetical protein
MFVIPTPDGSKYIWPTPSDIFLVLLDGNFERGPHFAAGLDFNQSPLYNIHNAVWTAWVSLDGSKWNVLARRELRELEHKALEHGPMYLPVSVSHLD